MASKRPLGEIVFSIENGETTAAAQGVQTFAATLTFHTWACVVGTGRAAMIEVYWSRRTHTLYAREVTP